MSAVIEASKTVPHRKILIIEKMREPGGNLGMSSAGQNAAIGSKQQQLAGIIEDSVELVMMGIDMLKAGIDLNHPNLLRRMIEESNDMVKWTEDELLGIEYRTRVSQMGGHSVSCTLSTMNACSNDIIDPMLWKVKAMLNINTAFEEFVLSENGDHVKGIQVRSKQDDYIETILFKKGMILAIGGFSTDVKFWSIQNPSFNENVMSIN
eukprot:scaffold104129_cov38-Attheya_sp.AAC.1